MAQHYDHRNLQLNSRDKATRWQYFDLVLAKPHTIVSVNF